MKRTLCLVISIILIFSTTIFVFADPEESTYLEEGDVTVDYVAASQVTSSLSISAGGTATYSATLYPKASATITYVNATIKLVKSNGTVIKTKNEIVHISNGKFKISDSKALSSSGSYKATYTLKVYKLQSCQETITGSTAYKAY